MEFDAYTGSGWQGAVDSTVPIPIGRVFHFALQYSSDGTGLAKIMFNKLIQISLRIDFCNVIIKAIFCSINY